MTTEFDDAVSRSLQASTAGAARVGYVSAIDTSPDAYAEAQRIARRTGIPVDSVLAYPQDAKREAAVGSINFDTLAKTAPATAALLADVEKAKISHDDVQNLKDTENVLKAWQGPKPTFSSVAGGFAEALKFKPLTASLRLAFNDLLFGAGSTPEDQVRRADLVRKAGQAQAQQAAATPSFESLTASGLYAGGVSLLQNLPGLAASIMTGSPAPGLALAGINSAAPAYGKYASRGATIGEATGGALAEGALEVATEALPMGFFVSKFGKVGAGEFVAGMLGREIPSEIVATVTQNLVDAAVANPDVTMGDYLRQQPDAIYQTILATLVQGGVMGGASKVVQIASGRAAQADAAERTAQQIEALNQMAAASKVLQRDSQTFEQFIATASESSPVQTVFIDAKTLLQTGMADQLAAASPAVAAQLQDAAVTGGQIAIPVAEYAAKIAPTEAAGALLDHLRTDPEGFSRSEAQAYMQEQAPELRREIERIIADQQGDESFKASAGVVKDIIKQQLDATGRFTPDVHDAYSTIAGNFYAVQAAKLGLTPEALYERYPLTVTAEGMGGQTFDQFAGQSSRTADRYALSSAQQRLDAGEDAEKVRQDTGWFKGADGKWRYEINDKDAKFLTEPSDPDTYADIFDEANNRSNGVPLGNALYHPSLFAAYPALKAVRLRINNKAKHDGVYSSEDNAIEIRDPYSYKGSMDTALSILLHEIQHGIQHIEGFAAGGNTEEVAKNNPDPQAVNDARILRLRIDKGESPFESRQWFRENLKRDPAPEAAYLSERYSTKELFALPSSPMDGYKRLAGEVEARNTQARQNMSDEDRRATPPSATADVADSNVIVMFNGKEMQNAPMPVNVAQGPRGSFSPSRWSMSLMKGADLSTFLHESGHAFLEMQIDMAARLQVIDELTPGEQSLMADTDALLRWFGLRDLAEWQSLDFEEKRDYHEKFARGFEAYLFEGKAPSIELQGLFQRFRAWLLAIYRDMKALNVELTDEVRGVMDRMVATTEQIQLAEMGRSMMPLFSTAQDAGMTPEEFAAYQSIGTQATADAIEDLQARGLRDLAWIQRAKGREVKRLQKQAKEARDEIEREVRREVMSRPVYQAWQFMTGKSDDPAEAGKFSMQGLDDIGAKPEAVALLKARRMTAKNGIHPDIVAERFGFSSGDELVQALVAAERPADEIEALTDQRMLETNGDLVTPEAIERAADIAIHNDARARMVATEANALAKAAGQRKVLADAAREYAAAIIARLKVREIRPSMYATAEAKAARAAEKASRAGDIATAAAEKRNQLVQGYATRAAYDAQDEIAAGLRYLKKFDTDAARKGLTPDYTDQIDALLERFDLRKGQSLKAIDKRKSLMEWLNAQRDAGFEPDVPPELENEAMRKSYKDMTVEEFRGLVATVKQIEHLGRLKQRLLTAADQRAYEVVRDEIARSIEANANGREADTRTPDSVLGRSLATVKRFGAAHIKVATWAKIMDGGKEGGPVWEYFVRQANAKADFETTRRAEATLKLSEILAPVFRDGKLSTRTFYPSINRSLTREARIAIALNWGNEGNRQRLVGGEGWTPQQVLPVLQSLTANEWAAVQAIWDHFESYRPEIAAKERRVYGKEPEWVQPIPFTLRTADGQDVSLRGGYYPIKYDTAASQRAEEHADAEGAKRQMHGAYTSATTRRSFTKARAEEVSGRPLLYSLSGIYSGVNDVIHDLAWHEWLIDTNRLLRSNTIDAAIRGHYGPDVKAQFKSWAADIAEGEKGTQDAIDSALNFVRRSVSVAGLGFNLMSAVQQPLGLSQSAVVVGPGWLGRGLSRYIAAPVAATREVNAKSSFMENRARTRFRELNELRNQVEGQSAAKEWIGRYAFWMMMRFQQAVDVPTWLAGYERAIADGNTEERAIALADQVVIDSQGGGQLKDQAAVERTGPGGKLFTVFYSFMNTALNVGVAESMTETSRARLAAKYALLYIVPPMLGFALKNAVTPGDSGDDDPEKLARKLAAQQIDYLMGLMVGVRELSDVAKTLAGANDMGRDYQGPAGLRLVADAGKFAQQLAQGEFDDALRKSFVNILGDLAGLPSAQINRTITGAQALADGETDNPAALAFGFQKPR